MIQSFWRMKTVMLKDYKMAVILMLRTIWIKVRSTIRMIWMMTAWESSAKLCNSPPSQQKVLQQLLVVSWRMTQLAVIRTGQVACPSMSGGS